MVLKFEVEIRTLLQVGGCKLDLTLLYNTTWFRCILGECSVSRLGMFASCSSESYFHCNKKNKSDRRAIDCIKKKEMQLAAPPMTQ